ncbi:MAG: hypothetical protein ABL921_33805 [Pirellula sp.]
MNTTDPSITRRRALSLVAVSVTAIQLGCTREQAVAPQVGAAPADDAPIKNKTDTRHGESMNVHYLEIVTTDVDAACKLYSQIHGVTFGDAVQNLGGARTANVTNGGMIGVRAPMHDGEKPVTRAYALVEDIEATVAAASKAGAVIAVPPMKIEGHGQCAIYFLGGIEAGLWQL